MAEFDGAVRINTELNRSDFIAGTKEIISAIRNFQESVENLGSALNGKLDTVIGSINGKISTMAQNISDASGRISTSLEDDLRAMGEFDDTIPRNPFGNDIESEGRSLEDMFIDGAISADELRSRIEEIVFEMLKLLEQVRELGASYSFFHNAAGETGSAFDFADNANESVIPLLERLQELEGEYEQIVGIIGIAGNEINVSTDGIGRSAESASDLSGELENAAQTAEDVQTAAEGTADAEHRAVEEAERLVDAETEAAGVDDGEPPVDTEQVREAAYDFDELTRKVQRYQDAIEAQGRGGDAFRNLQSEIQRTESQIDRLTDQIEQMERAGVDEHNQGRYERLNRTLDETRHEFGQLVKLRDEALGAPDLSGWNNALRLSTMLRNAFGAIRNAAQTALYAIHHPLELVDVAFGVATKAAIDFAQNVGKTVLNGAVHTLKSLGSSALHAAANLARMAGSGALTFLRRLADGAKNAAIQLTKMVSSAVTSGLKKLTALAGKATKALAGMNKQGNGDSFKDGLRFIIRYVLGVRSMFMLVRRLRSALGEAFQNMAKKVPEVNKSLSALVSSLDRLKNSMGTAFQPILTAITPILVQLMDTLSEAMTRVGMFFAALTGQNYVYKATKANIDYAKSLDKTKKKAKEAQNQLAGFDHLNILSDNSNDDSSSTETPTSDFEKVPVDSKIADFAKKIVDAFRNNELYKIGKQFADLVNGFFRDTARWEKIGKKLGKVINGIVDAFNGFMDNVKWDNIGKALGKAIDGLLDTVNWKNLGKAFSQKINAIFGILWGIVQDTTRWKKLGKALADLVEGYFGNINWELIGKTIGTAINGIATAITEFATNFPWAKMGEKLSAGIRKLVDTIDIEKVYTAFSELLKGILDFIYPILSDTETWNKIAADFSTFLKNFFEDDALWDKASAALRAGLRNTISSMNRIFGDGTLLADVGSRLAKFLNDLMGDKELWGGIGDLANNMMKGVLSFGDKFLDEFDPTVAADNIKLALGKIQWEDIANDTWATIKKFFSKAGSFVDALFSESTEGLSGDALKKATDFNAKPIGTRMAEKIKGVFTLDLWKDVAKTVWDTARQGFAVAGDFISALLDVDTAGMEAGEKIAAIGEALATKLGEFGAQVGTALANLPWRTILDTAFKVIGDTIQGLLAGLLGDESGNGKVLLWIAGGIIAIKAGIIPLLAKLIAGLAAGVLAGGPILEAAVVAAFGAAVYKSATLVGEILASQKELNDTLRRNSSKALDDYVMFYQTKGAEWANNWAESCWLVELEGNDLQKNLETIGLAMAESQGTAFCKISADAAIAGSAYKQLAEDATNGGKEAADKWAESILHIDTSNLELEDSIRSVKSAVMGLAQDDSIRNEIRAACDEIITEGTTTADTIETTAKAASENAKTSIESNAADAVSAVESANEDISVSAETVEEKIKSAMEKGNADMIADVKSSLNEDAKAWDEGLNAINKTAETGYSKAANTVKTKTDEMAKTSKSASDEMTSTATTGTDDTAKEYIDKYYEIAYIVDVSMSDAANYMKKHTETMMETVRNGMRDMVNLYKESMNTIVNIYRESMNIMVQSTLNATNQMMQHTRRMVDTFRSGMNDLVNMARQGMNNMVQTMRGVDFQPIGANIIQGIANGINNGWTWLNNLVWDLANSLYRSAKNALGIASPSKVFRDEVGYMVGAGLAEGLDDSQHTVLNSLTDMAIAMVDEMQDTDLTADIGVSDSALLDGLNNVLTSFSGTVENSFTTLTKRLQAIADTVTFRTPDIAAGLVLPYAIQGQSNVNTDDVSIALDKNNEELISVIIQAVNNQTSAIVQALMQNGGNNSPIDIKAITSGVIEEHNRMTRAAGKSPLLI